MSILFREKQHSLSLGIKQTATMALSAIFVVTIGTLVLLLHRLSKVGRRPKDYPPGPPTLPIIGNLHQMPTEKGHLQFQKWAEEYGPIYSLILGTNVMIVLSSDKTIKDLLDRRSGIYSSRPEMYLGQIISGGFRVLLMVSMPPPLQPLKHARHSLTTFLQPQEYGETWRMIRKLVHNNLNIKAARTYVPYQDLENKAMLLGFLEKPNQFVDHIRRYTNSLTTQMVFGFRTTSTEDPKLKQLYHVSLPPPMPDKTLQEYPC